MIALNTGWQVAEDELQWMLAAPAGQALRHRRLSAALGELCSAASASIVVLLIPLACCRLRPYRSGTHEAPISLRQALVDENLLGAALAGPSWATWRAVLIGAMGESFEPAEAEAFDVSRGDSR